MLRKKLLARLGLLVLGFVVGAAVSITLLQGVLSDIDAANAQAERVMDRVQGVIAAVGELEDTVVTTGEAGQVSNSELIGVIGVKLAAVGAAVDRLAEVSSSVSSADQSSGEMAASLALIRRALEQTQASPGVPSHAGVQALKSAVSSHATIARRHVTLDQANMSRRLRTLIVGLTIAALVMTNISIFVLVRTANMILRPVAELIEGSRQLASEHFDHRVRVMDDGEFGELASAYNALADQLASNEQKKVKALQHLAVTLNHELNNVINAIDLQLSLMNRRSGDDPRMGTHLAEIHSNLARMARTVASLRNVRRVVLTDYMPGEPMLDLPKSTAEEEPSINVRPVASDRCQCSSPASFDAREKIR